MPICTVGVTRGCSMITIVACAVWVAQCWRSVAGRRLLRGERGVHGLASLRES
jgi:hypothetical protein